MKKRTVDPVILGLIKTLCETPDDEAAICALLDKVAEADLDTLLEVGSARLPVWAMRAYREYHGLGRQTTFQTVMEHFDSRCDRGFYYCDFIMACEFSGLEIIVWETRGDEPGPAITVGFDDEFGGLAIEVTQENRDCRILIFPTTT